MCKKGLIEMAGNLSNKNYGTGYCEFYVDTDAEVALLPTTTKKASGEFAKNPNFDFTPAVGSTVIVGNDGNMKVYMLSSSGWHEI